MKKILMISNPNVGKSLLFSRITGKGSVSANYAGTTVKAETGKFKYNNREYKLIDCPGIYSLDEETSGAKELLQLIDDSDIIINVVDATNLERNLNLTLQLLQLQKPTVVCLNFWDDTTHYGITIDVPRLEQILGVPVVPVSALHNQGIPKLLDSLEEASTSNLSYSAEDHWKEIGAIIHQVQTLEHRHHTLTERISDLTLHPVGGVIFAIGVLLATLIIVRFMGEGMINYILEPFYFDVYAPYILNLASNISSDLIRSLLVGTSLDPLETFGILTSGLYIALVLVFPYFFSFYLIFGILEDVGYLPRLAVLLDNIFHRLGLHGYSSIPIMLGLGCKVPALLSTRILNNEREKILTIALILMSAPCLPQTAMIISLGMNYSIAVVLFIFAVLLVVAVATNVAINKILPGTTEEFFSEIPAYRRPSVALMGKKLWGRMVEYFAEVAPMIVIGVLLMSLLDYLHVIEFLTKTIQKPVELVLGLPAEIAPIILLGFLRKDVSIALLPPLQLSAQQFIVASVFLVLYSPCIAAFFTMLKELGLKTQLKLVFLIFFIALGVSSFLHMMFTLLF